ncbi:unnamed protein product, partial [Owenia fusiformis]
NNSRKRTMNFYIYSILANVILICSVMIEQSNASVLKVHESVAKLNKITDRNIIVKSAYSAKLTNGEPVANLRSKRSAYFNFNALMPGPRFHRHIRHNRPHRILRRRKFRQCVLRKITTGRKGTWTWLPAYKRYAWLPEEKPDKDDSFSKLMRYGK